MTRILKHNSNSEIERKYLIPKTSDLNTNQWVEIMINFRDNTFYAKKIFLAEIGDEWKEYTDYTFPSSLLNEFLNHE